MRSRLLQASFTSALRARTLFGFITLVAVASRVPGVDRFLEYDRVRVMAGEIWRLATGHLSHWNVEHLAWDLGAFVLLSLIILSRRNLEARYVTVIGISAFAITTFQLVASPELALYRGLSGIDSALFMYLAANIVREAYEKGDRPEMIVSSICAIGFVAKIVAEASGSGPLFATGLGQDVSMTISAHVIGAIAGIGAVLVRYRSSSSRTGRHFLGIRPSSRGAALRS